MALNLTNTSIYNNGTTVDDSENLFVDFFRTTQPMRISPWIYPGYNRGFVGLGSPEPGLTTFDTFPFAAAVTNAIPGGNFTRGADQTSCGTNSETHGYSAGGGNAATPLPLSNVIDRFPFAATPANAVDVGDLTVGRQFSGAHSSSTHGYCSVGRSAAVPVVVRTNVVDKWLFASAVTNATNTGQMNGAIDQVYSQSSSTHGYVCGGVPTAVQSAGYINRFPFASDNFLTILVTPLVSPKSAGGSCSSQTHGYNTGGANGTTILNAIERFVFSSGTTTTGNIGTLTVARWQSAGASSVDFGYTMAGRTTATSPVGTNIIDRFPFASNSTNAVDVGDMTTTRWEVIGLHY